MSLTTSAPKALLISMPQYLPWLIALLLVEAVVLLMPGHLAVDAHEVDTLHAAGAVMKIVEGARPHLDFLTPLGVLAFYPVAWFVEAGLSLPRAFLAANLAAAVVLLPMLARVMASRLPGILGLAFGAWVIVMVTAVVYGGDQANVSVSMAYNRWAWGVAAIIVMLAVVPSEPGAQNPALDGALMGLCLGILALLKGTAFVAMAPVVALALMMRRDVRALLAMGCAGVGVALVATALCGGLAFWVAYFGDLVFVREAAVRPHPGLEWRSLLAAPAYFPTVLCLLGLVVALRKGGAEAEGTLVLALLPAFVFMTFQNWGNDPKWVVLLGILALRLRVVDGPVFGARAPQVLGMVAVAAFTIGAPSVMNMAISPLRNAFASEASFMPMLADPGHRGLWIERKRSFDAEGTGPVAGLRDPEGEAAEPLRLSGVEIPRCVLSTGYFGSVLATAQALEAAGYAGQAVLYVDVTNPLAMVGDFAPVPGEAPWYYGGVAGVDAADVVVVPTCGVSNNTATHYMAALEAYGAWNLRERTAHYLAFEPR